MNEHLRRAVEALQRGAAEIHRMSPAAPPEVRARLRQTAEEVLQHLEAEPEDVMSSLDRQSRDIAEDLRRVERLMNERLGHE